MPFGWVAASVALDSAIQGKLNEHHADDATDAAVAEQDKIAAQQKDIGLQQLDFSKQQYADAKARQDKFDPLYEQIINQSLADSKTNQDRSAQQWQQYVDNFMPAETKLSQAALNYDTAGRRDEAGAAARAAVETQGAMARADQNRSLNRAGISLSSGRALALDNASRLAQTKLSTGADLTARDNVEKTGLSLVGQVAGMGRGLTSTSLAASSQAQANGNSAAGGLSTQQQTYNQSLAPAISLMGAGSDSLARAGSLYGNIVNQYQRQSEASAAGLGSLASLGLRAYGAYSGTNTGGSMAGGYGGLDTNGWLGGAATAGDYSDVRLKKNIRRIGKTARGHNLYTWDWKTGGSSSGVLAQEVGQTNPELLTADEDGIYRVDYSKV